MNNKITFLLLVITGCVSGIMNAQEIEISHSEPIDIARNYDFGDHLVSDGQGHFVYFYDDHAISIVEFKDDLTEPFIDEIKTGDNDINHVKLLYVGDKFYWITYTVNFKSKRFEYEYTPISLSGKMGKPRKIVDFRYKNENRIPVFNYKYSPDSSMLLMTLEIDFNRDDPYSSYMAVMDSEFNKVYESDYETEISQRQMECKGWSLTNDGTVYFLTKQYDKLSRRNEKKVKGEYYPAFEIHVHRHTAQGGDEKAIGVEGEFVKSYDLACNQDGTVVAFLGYGYREEDPIVGFQFQTIDPSLAVSKVSDLVFAEYGFDGYSRVELLSNKRGEGLRPEYDMVQLAPNQNGGFDALLDYHYVHEDRNYNNGRFGTMNVTYIYIDLSLVSMSLDSEGEFIKANIIPRRYSNSNVLATGITMISEGTDINLFYNDFSYNLKGDIENPSRSIFPRYQWPKDQNFVFTTLYEDNVIERTPLFNMGDEDHFSMPSKVYRIGKNKYFFASLYSRGFRTTPAVGIFSF